MENDIIYFSDFPNLQETGTRKDNGKFDLTLLPTQELKEEFRGYIMYRCKNGTFRALIQDRTAYNHIAKFLNSRINRRIKSLGDRNPEKWISLLKGWMLEQGITIVKEKKSVYGTVSYGEAVTILYFRNVLKFLGPEDLRDEIEKDVWELKNLDIKIRSNPIYNVKTLDFRKIYQPDIREECKKAVYMNLQYEAIGTVQGELTIMRIFSEYLQKEYSKIKSCSEIDREVLEEFLIHLSTKDTSHSANSSYVISLRRQLETIGKIYSYERLEHLFINTDIPPEVNAEFRVYSDDEMKRLNAEITQMDVQIARCLLIHQMLGTRISDTLTLRPDCLTRENGQDMIEIYQVKTKRYKKPISKELAKLLQSSIEYTHEKFGDPEYIFVNEKEPDRPMQYMAIKTKVMSMIQEKQLKDDHGELFGFGTHMFRHYYGVKLTEMHLDDWTIARLLGHKRLNNVQHYRKMSNQRMADETRVWQDGVKNMSKYDKMIEENQRKSKEKIELALQAIQDMLANKERISVPKLMKKTGLSRGFFYKNPTVRDTLNQAVEQQAGMIDPRREILNMAMEKQIELLNQKVAALSRENKELKRKNEKLQKALRKQDLNFIKNL